jgi:hypothetical protein
LKKLSKLQTPREISFGAKKIKINSEIFLFSEMDKLSKELSADLEIRVIKSAPNQLNTQDLEKNCLDIMEMQESQKGQKSDNNSEYFDAESYGTASTSQKMNLENEIDKSDEFDDLDLDIPEIDEQLNFEQHPESQEELETSLAKINEIFAMPASKVNTKRGEPDIIQPHVLTQPEAEKNKTKNISSTQMEVKAIQDILGGLQSEDFNGFNDLLNTSMSARSEAGSSGRQPKRSWKSKYNKVFLNKVLPNVLNYTTVAIAGIIKKIN